MNINTVGLIEIDGRILYVYYSLDKPFFKASNVGLILGYDDENLSELLKMCEEDEKMLLPIVVNNQKCYADFITENGLYNMLSQSRKPFARKWRRMIHDQIIDLRKEHDMTVIELFEIWEERLANIYYDEETGILMRSVTVEGGDVIQIPFDGEL